MTEYCPYIKYTAFGRSPRSRCGAARRLRQQPAALLALAPRARSGPHGPPCALMRAAWRSSGAAAHKGPRARRCVRARRYSRLRSGLHRYARALPPSRAACHSPRPAPVRGPAGASAALRGFARAGAAGSPPCALLRRPGGRARPLLGQPRRPPPPRCAALLRQGGGSLPPPLPASGCAAARPALRVGLAPLRRAALLRLRRPGPGINRRLLSGLPPPLAAAALRLPSLPPAPGARAAQSAAFLPRRARGRLGLDRAITACYYIECRGVRKHPRVARRRRAALFFLRCGAGLRPSLPSLPSGEGGAEGYDPLRRGFASLRACAARRGGRSRRNTLDRYSKRTQDIPCPHEQNIYYFVQEDTSGVSAPSPSTSFRTNARGSGLHAGPLSVYRSYHGGPGLSTPTLRLAANLRSNSTSAIA